MRQWMAAVLLVVAGSFAAPAQAGEPERVVADFHRAILSVMAEAGTLGPRGRYERLKAPLTQGFHLGEMARIATGRAWATAGQPEREALVDAFAHMAIATYANRFDDYSGQSFETLGVEPGPSGSRLVQTRIVRPRKEPVRIDYVMTERDGRWGVHDILLAGGISQLATWRSEYAATLRSGGLPALTQSLRRKGDQQLAAG
ncbi:MAG: ABC transporter substrate-binding protein [Alphaproteobacteria bacterium]|nr:ABC transporter substrate-binding protein [Alphaproteobacteria bacterium]